MSGDGDMNESKPLATRELSPLAIPMMDIEELKKLTAYVNDVKRTLMKKDRDYVIDGDKQYTARSGFSKLAQGFNLSDDPPIITKVTYDEPKTWKFTYYLRRKKKEGVVTTNMLGFEAIVVVRNPYGRQATGEGACTIEELHMTNNMSPKWYHRVLATAKTRAYNRAVSNFVGSADVSAEEMGLVYDTEEPERKHVDSAQSEAPVQITSVAGMETYLGDNGFDSGLVEIVDELETLVMTPIQYLKDEWRPINELVKRAGGSWVKTEDKKNYWRIPIAESPEEEQPQEPEEETAEFNPFSLTMKVVKSIQEIEYILDGKFPGAQDLFSVTEDVRSFTVEPMKVLDTELVQEATMLLMRLGGEYREVSGSIGYIWIIEKKE